jgi:hypothetical protein
MAAPNLRGGALIFYSFVLSLNIRSLDSHSLNGVIMDNAAISLSLFLWIRQDSLHLSFCQGVGFVY